jgi:glycosyltransferase involved in cell wall biosynthesis
MPPPASRPSLLVVVETLGPGGAERALVTLLPELVRGGMRVAVAALSEPYDLADELDLAGVPVHRLGDARRSFWRTHRRLRKLVRGEGFDVLHAHLFVASVHVALAGGAKRVVTLHNLGYDSYPARTIRQRGLFAAHAVLMRHRVDRLVAVSNAVADHHAAHLRLLPQSIAVMPNAMPDRLGPETRPDDAIVRRQFGIAPQVPLVVLPGRFVPEKNQGQLVEAAVAMASVGREVVFVLVGDGPTAAGVRRDIQDKGLDDSVLVLGTLAHETLVTLLSVADVVTLVSTHEGSPLAIAEAMQLGRCVLATSVGGLPELVQDGRTGILVPPGQLSDYVEALATLLADAGLRDSLGSAAATDIAARLTVSSIAPSWVELYSDLVAASPRRRGRPS